MTVAPSEIDGNRVTTIVSTSSTTRMIRRGPFQGADLSPGQVTYLANEYRRKLCEPYPEPAKRYFRDRLDELLDSGNITITVITSAAGGAE